MIRMTIFFMANENYFVQKKWTKANLKHKLAYFSFDQSYCCQWKLFTSQGNYFLCGWQPCSKPLVTRYQCQYSYFTSCLSQTTLDIGRPLSPLSRSRLPYHSLLYGDPWKVLGKWTIQYCLYFCLSSLRSCYMTWNFVLFQIAAPELSEETVPKLLGIANLLKVRQYLFPRSCLKWCCNDTVNL